MPVYLLNVYLCKLFFYITGLLRPSKDWLYIYTDSRGFVIGNWYSKKNPIGSYILQLLKNYNIKFKICEYKHTTILDFLADIAKEDISKYKKIILHVGVVDFSPRPKNDAVKLHKAKKIKAGCIFNSTEMESFNPRYMEEKYKGEDTLAIYDLEFFEKFILDKLSEFGDKLIWISVNEVVIGWDGTYFQKRPGNMNSIMDYQKICDNYDGLFKIIEMKNDDSSVMEYTVDNVHLSKGGMQYVYYEIINAVEK